MYHYVSQPPTDADVYRKDLSVAPDRFREHLAYLKDASYSVVTLDDLLYALAQGRALPPKPVILTFDDGYRDNYENAFPALRDENFVGTFFIITDFVTAERPEYMTWPQIQEMAAAGQKFGSHSRNHPNLEGQPIDYLVWQALGSREAIEVRLGQTPRWVAYPSGKYDAQTIAVFRSAGFWGAVTVQQGVEHATDKTFELRRIRVRGSHSAADLARLLEMNWQQ
jgi:peptidoglycan/xylan/chitin deacetylase (PgdA/CDA1 family)